MFQLWLCSTLRQRYCDLVFASAAVLVLNVFTLAQQPGQKTFRSPEDASKALYSAVQSNNPSAMIEIFGPDANEIISTGDPVEDENTRDQFVTKYKEMHHVGGDENGTTTLYIGAEDWPLPVPLVRESGMWHFDTEAGKEEILYRRVGENELVAMNVCHALVEAESDYYNQPRDGQIRQYAQTMVSDEGRHNGLFWETADGEPVSPIGALVAYASAATSSTAQKYENSPFHGYYFRIVTAQGRAASGGARSYIVNGQMTGGFAILAYPAEYRSSGVMTFIVNQTGVLYQKDVGAVTVELGSNMKEYAPDDTWKKVE